MAGQSLIWLRKDIRQNDHEAFFNANKFGDPIIAVYIANFSKFSLSKICKGQIQLILDSLGLLKDELKEKNIPLFFKSTRGSSFKDVMMEVLKKYNIKQVFFHHVFDPYEIKEQRHVEALCKFLSIDTYIYNDQLMLDPHTVLTGSKTPFKMFTPFYNYYLRHQMIALDCKPFRSPSKQSIKTYVSSKIPRSIKGFESQIKFDQYPRSTAQALKRLQNFLKNKVARYHLDRDRPDLSGTSFLSSSLAIGLITVKQCILEASKFNKNQIQGPCIGLNTWISELIWREFYRYILVHNPHILEGEPFNLKTNKLKWNKKKDLYSAFVNAKTGVPIVDAAIVQLKETGWMHNRLRMIVASFLVKNCNIDWRLGEAFFYKHLIDADFASNNGGWQWSSSVGVDAAPYFRIMNPFLQSKKFDPQGNFIAKFLPNFSLLESSKRHDPSTKDREEIGYCMQVLDVKKTRLSAIKRFSEIK